MDEFLIKKLDSLLKTCYQKNMGYLTHFLSSAEQEYLLKEIKNYKGLEVIFSGAFLNATYQKAIIKPVDLNMNDFNLCLLKFNYNPKYIKLSHRNVLGSLMSLGLERNRFGDILVLENKVYFASSNEVIPFLQREFKMIMKEEIELEITDEIISLLDNGTKKTIFVSSLRLDAFLSQALNISRTNAVDLIKSEMVKINQITSSKITKEVKNDDLISIRHYGRIKLLNSNNKSKSERIICEIKIYK